MVVILYIQVDVYFSLQDTCVGFLLGGIGEINKHRHSNFMVVDKSKIGFDF